MYIIFLLFQVNVASLEGFREGYISKGFLEIKIYYFAKNLFIQVFVILKKKIITGWLSGDVFLDTCRLFYIVLLFTTGTFLFIIWRTLSATDVRLDK